MRLTLSILRFNPQTDSVPYFQSYEVEWEPRDTVLDILTRVRLQDPTLAFRRSCRSGICGSCAMFIGDRCRLACQTLIKDVVAGGEPLVIKPMPGFRQLKDLVVDMEPFFAALHRVLPWVLTVPQHDGLVPGEASQRIQGPATCILCGICDSEIKESGTVTPAALVKNVRLAVDPRDALGMDRLCITGLTREGMQSFREVLAAVCPKGIKLPVIIME